MADDPIKHVVLLALENHSFDQMLGGLQEVFPDLEGVSKTAPTPNQNVDSDGTVYFQEPTRERQMRLDPHHEVDWVTEGAGSGLHLASVLQEGRENANIHAGLGFI
jgi:phospholipase C